MNKRGVIQYTKDMKKIREWGSICEAQEVYNISHISAVCRGERLSDGGYIWRYASTKPKKNVFFREAGLLSPAQDPANSERDPGL